MESFTRAVLPAGGGVTAYLEFCGVDDDPVVYPLGEEVLIGRERQDSFASDRFLCIPEPTVSRRHARIWRRGDVFFVEDLHSSNGTFVLGNRLKPGACHRLNDGDELSVSSAHLVFRSHVAPARDNVHTIVTTSIDATQLTKSMGAMADGTRRDLQVMVQRLHAMAQVGIALGAETDRATLIEKIMNFIFELFPPAERAFILLREGGSEAPVPAAVRWRDGTVEDPAKVRLSRTIVEQVLTRKQSILSVDTLSDIHFGSQESIVAQAIRSVMCVPLLLEGEVLGLLQVDTSSDPYAFKEQDLEVLTGVCAETAVALKNFQLYSDIERLLEGFVKASVQAIEERDPVTAGHSFRVADYAERLAVAVDRCESADLSAIGFTKEQVREIRYAALLHDFGKVGVREHVLRKAKKLHHFEMILLEQRFDYARACIERHAYHQLAELHCQRGLNLVAFKQEKRRIEDELDEECERLDQFLQAIKRANEPALSHASEGCAELRLVRDYAYRRLDGAATRLLDEHEFSALSVPKGCLTAEERRQIESHVADSYSFLILIPWTRDLAGVPAIAHGHHEKLDGSGYPLGLRGEQISIQARVLAICDIFDALTAADRPYKKAVPMEQALDLMATECHMGRLDASLFRVFVDSQAWKASS